MVAVTTSAGKSMQQALGELGVLLAAIHLPMGTNLPRAQQEEAVGNLDMDPAHLVGIQLLHQKQQRVHAGHAVGVPAVGDCRRHQGQASLIASFIAAATLAGQSQSCHTLEVAPKAGGLPRRDGATKRIGATSA